MTQYDYSIGHLNSDAAISIIAHHGSVFRFASCFMLTACGALGGGRSARGKYVVNLLFRHSTPN